MLGNRIIHNTRFFFCHFGIRSFSSLQIYYHTLFGVVKVLHGPGHSKMCLMPYANNKGADQPAHPRSLISTFVVRCLYNIMPQVSISEISRL